MSESYISTSPTGTSFVGPDAIGLYRAMVLKSSLSLWLRTKIIPARGMTITKLLAIVKDYTGKGYRPKETATAIEDLTVWIETMKSAMPVEVVV